MDRPASSGMLVALEGIDGAGKTTQATLLEQRLRGLGAEVVRTKEPTSGVHGMRLRRAAAGQRLAPEEELETFILDRRDHVERVLAPSLRRGAAVIVDRYFFSTAAYQGALGFDPEEILRRNEEFAPLPDLLVILEIDAAAAMRRIGARGEAHSAFEKAEYLERVAEVFARLQRPYVERIDGEMPPEAIAARIAGCLPERALQALWDHGGLPA